MRMNCYMKNENYSVYHLVGMGRDHVAMFGKSIGYKMQIQNTLQELHVAAGDLT